MARIIDILRMTTEERKNTYKAVGIDKVIIDGNEFTDYGVFTFLREKSYVKSPNRSGKGTIDNLNSYASFTTPHLKIDFSLMSIDSYRRIMELIYSKNEFLVECYDVVQNRVVQEKMYFTTEEMPKLWTIAKAVGNEEWVELLGVHEYTVEMVGTNVSLETVDILYYDQSGNLIAEATQSVNKGALVEIGYDYVPTSGYRFDGEWTDDNGTVYRNDDIISITRELKLYVKVKNTSEYTLSFNYGIGIVPINSANAQPISSVPAISLVSINSLVSNANIITSEGTLFVFPENGTGLEDITYTLGEESITKRGVEVYDFKGWYLDNITSPSTKITGSTPYAYNENKTIFQVYESKKFTLSYNTGVDFITLSSQQLGYKDLLNLPTLARAGYVFGGWYFDSAFKIKATESMLPQNLTVYAKWEEKSE